LLPSNALPMFMYKDLPEKAAEEVVNPRRSASSAICSPLP
jgi:hypothetical protein